MQLCGHFPNPSTQCFSNGSSSENYGASIALSGFSSEVLSCVTNQLAKLEQFYSSEGFMSNIMMSIESRYRDEDRRMGLIAMFFSALLATGS